jgi:acyl phosphate:glycerol-3-phosphate acyltransferase
MITDVYIALGLLGAYLIGSIPTAVWYSKAFYGFDVRDHGSGNAGATNTFRVLGKKAGIIVMSIDTFKGFVASASAMFLFDLDWAISEKVIIFKLLYGIAAVIGHVFPAFAQFRGGKGVATLLGMVIAIHPPAALVCMGVFIVVFMLSKYVSLGSLIAAISFPVLMFVPYFNPGQPIVVVFAFAMCSIVVLTHQKNIRRLLNGEENKMNLRSPKS